MEYINKFKKEPRLIIAVLNLIFFFLPWISVNTDDWGLDAWGLGDWGADISTNASGFGMISGRFSVFFLVLIAAFLIAIPFIPAIEKYKKLLFAGVPLLAIILSFIITAGLTGEYFGIEINHGIGFWLSMLANLAILVLTFIIDFKVSSQSFKQKGIQGVFSDVAGQFSSSASGMASGISRPKTPAPANNVACPSCNATLVKGTKFCPSCGTQLPEAKKCTGCGAELATGAVFCPNCGTKAE